MLDQQQPQPQGDGQHHPRRDGHAHRGRRDREVVAQRGQHVHGGGRDDQQDQHERGLDAYQRPGRAYEQHADQRDDQQGVERRRIEVGEVRSALTAHGEAAEIVERQHASGPGEGGDGKPGQGDAQAAQRRGGSHFHGAVEPTEQ